MAIKELPQNPLYLINETTIEEKLIEFATTEKQKTYNSYLEDDYNLVLSKADFEFLVNSIENPQYNDKLATALKRKLIFD